MLKYKKIGPYIIECSPIDDYTYNIALWHISKSSLDCELCEVMYAPSYRGAVAIWQHICARIAISVGVKKPCSEWSVSSTQMKDTTTSEKGFPLLRESNSHD